MKRYFVLDISGTRVQQMQDNGHGPTMVDTTITCGKAVGSTVEMIWPRKGLIKAIIINNKEVQLCAKL